MTTVSHPSGASAFTINLSSDWTEMTAADWTALRDEYATGGIEYETPECSYCERGDVPALATFRRVCDDCRSTLWSCHACVVDQKPDDFSVRRFEKFAPQMMELTQKLGALDDQIAAISAERAAIFDETSRAMFAVLWPSMQTTTKIRVDEHEIVIGGDPDKEGTEYGFRLPRAMVPGDDPDTVKRNLLHILIGGVATMGEGLARTYEAVREQAHPSLMIQCDDFGPIDREHHAAVVATVAAGTPAEIAACNALLRMCARPARAFRSSDVVGTYGHRAEPQEGDAS